jgi:hypothetical protein
MGTFDIALADNWPVERRVEGRYKKYSDEKIYRWRDKLWK